jgi:hypothetical protein
MLAISKLMNNPRMACLPARAKSIGTDNLAKGIQLLMENLTDKIPIQPMDRCP